MMFIKTMEDYIDEFINKKFNEFEGSKYDKALKVYEYITLKKPNEFNEEIRNGYYDAGCVWKYGSYRAYCLMYNYLLGE